MKTEFETFRDLSGSYYVNQLKDKLPSNINFLNYRKYKVTIELVDESKEILLERLNSMLDYNNGYNMQERVKDEILKISKK